MRLFLSSNDFGNYANELKGLFKGKSAAIIMNAADYHEGNERKIRLDAEIEALALIGIDGREVDLRKFFGQKNGLEKEIAKYDLVWVRGGNVFILRRAMRQSGFDDLIRKMLGNDAIVYGGYSAGCCVLSPTLRGFELVDDKDSVVADYEPEVIWEGLGLLKYNFVPHYDSDHYESDAIDGTIEFYKHNRMPFKTLRDGQVILIDGNKEEFLE